MAARVTSAIRDDRKGNVKARPRMATRLIFAIRDDRKNKRKAPRA
jgi:hypothetical protein